ncbi:MAG: hypothetical protein ACKVIF_09085 [Rhodospirillales bacterium]
MKHFLCLVFVFSALLIGAPSTHADDALVNATSYEKFGLNVPISVRPLDNSDVNIMVQKEIERVLREKGFIVIDNAGLILSFETLNEEGAWSDRGDRQLIELKNQGGTPHSNNPEVRLNIFNSSRGGVFNSGKPGTTQVTPTTYELNATLENSSNGQRLWEGSTQVNLGLADEITLSKAMVPLLLETLGKTVRQKKPNLF